MEKVNFNLVQMFEETSGEGERFIEITSGAFDAIESSFHVTIDDTYYEVTASKGAGYIYFAFDFGSANPRDELVTNVMTGVKKNNPRKGVEAELLKQLFCLYYFDTRTLYISNYKKLPLFLNMLQKKLKRTFITKSFFKDREQFLSILKSVSKISFTEERDLFSQSSIERKALFDLTGTDAPERFTIEADYSNPFEIRPFLEKLCNSKDSDALRSLMICGKDESDFSVLYNHDTFLKKITIKCDKEESGKFNRDTILFKLLEGVSE